VSHDVEWKGRTVKLKALCWGCNHVNKACAIRKRCPLNARKNANKRPWQAAQADASAAPLEPLAELLALVPEAVKRTKAEWLQHAKERSTKGTPQEQEALGEELGETVASHSADLEKELRRTIVATMASAEKQIANALPAAEDRVRENLEVQKACPVCYDPLDASAAACSTDKCATRTCLKCLSECVRTGRLRVNGHTVKCSVCKDGLIKFEPINVPALSLGPVPPTPAPVHGLPPGPEDDDTDDDPDEVMWVRPPLSLPPSPSYIPSDGQGGN
jgi:hypothetical protein